MRYDPSQPDHVILETYQRGYRRGNEVFRPAKVVVNDLSHAEADRSDDDDLASPTPYLGVSEIGSEAARGGAIIEGISDG